MAHAGRLGLMILPVDGELLAPWNKYRKERLFVVLRFAGRLSDDQGDAVGETCASISPQAPKCS